MTVLAQADGLMLSYGHHIAVDTSSFTLPVGGVTAVIGPNGSGKSTILHALVGLIDPSAGSLVLLGSTPIQARSKVSCVFQSTRVPTGTPMTVVETVAMGRYSTLGMLRPMRAMDRKRVQAAMHELEIEDIKNRQLSELSGGQRQRVYVAQGIAQDHEVLLLDEPLTGLDLVSARTIDRIIHNECNHGGSVVLTTHDLEEAQAADHVILMNRRVVASGVPGEVLTRRNLEIAYGLGALHESLQSGEEKIFIDDPAHRECSS